MQARALRHHAKKVNKALYKNNTFHPKFTTAHLQYLTLATQTLMLQLKQAAVETTSTGVCAEKQCAQWIKQHGINLIRSLRKPLFLQIGWAICSCHQMTIDYPSLVFFFFSFGTTGLIGCILRFQYSPLQLFVPFLKASKGTNAWTPRCASGARRQHRGCHVARAGTGVQAAMLTC